MAVVNKMDLTKQDMRSQPRDFPLVVVVTPVYNGETYLAATLACIQRQTYPNILHIVFDNASTDRTPEIIRQFSNGRIPIVAGRNEEVLSLPLNWNAAFRLIPTEARYYQLICADDLLRSDAIEKFVALAENDPAINFVTAIDVVADRFAIPHPPFGKTIVDGWDFIRTVCNNAHNHMAWQAQFARWRPELGDGLNNTFDTAIGALEVPRALKVFERGKVGFVMEPLIYSRQHSGTFTSQLNRAHNPAAHLAHWNLCAAYARRAFQDEREANRVLRKSRAFMLRYQLYWRAIGAKQAVRAVADRLRRDGFAPSPLDYVRALVGYIPHKLHKRAISREAEAQTRFTGATTEADFLASGPPPPVSSDSAIVDVALDDASACLKGAGRSGSKISGG